MYGKQRRCCGLLVLVIFLLRFEPGTSWISTTSSSHSAAWWWLGRRGVMSKGGGQLGSSTVSSDLLNEDSIISSSSSSPASTASAATTATTVSEETTPPRLRELYPPSEAYANGLLQVDSLHSIYFEVHGNNSSRSGKKKKSALFLHGGPGAGCNPTHARFFNPDVYDTIVLLDQRGSGRSMPRAMVYNNTIIDLVHDCELLRRHINVSSWDVVLGGSFGTTLAICYAQEHPGSIKSLILRGVCLMRPAEIDWLFTPQGGAAQRNPQAWQNFVDNAACLDSNNDDLVVDQQIEVGESNDNIPDRTVLHQYYDDMFEKNATRRWNAARGWMTWEFTVSASFNNNRRGGGGDQDETVAANANATNQQTNNDTIPKSHAVLVSLPTGSGRSSSNWEYHDIMARPISEQDRISLGLDHPAVIASAKSRQGLRHSTAASTGIEQGQSLAPRPRPIAMTSADFVTAQAKAQQKDGEFSGLPALAMLTCFYSVNENYAMHDLNLLSPERMARIRGHPTNIPCIAIQGGQDPICPPDTALDVKEQWPEMELRIPLLAGHSMYHPEIVHELVQATDRIVFLS